MEPTIYKPGIYKTPGVNKGAGGIYKGRGLYNDGAGGGTAGLEIDGKIYPVVQIGNLYWLAENLDFSDSTIPIVTTYYNNEYYPRCRYYMNDPAEYGYNGKKYNLLYTGFCDEHIGQIIPDGWRVPTKSDFDNLVSSVSSPLELVREDFGGTNESGFSAPFSGFYNSNTYNADIFTCYAKEGQNDGNRYYLRVSSSQKKVELSSNTSRRFFRSIRICKDT